MIKHPMSDVLDKVEAELRVKQRARWVSDAAPELLSALTGLLLYIGVAGDSGRYAPGHPITRARTAIKKAGCG